MSSQLTSGGDSTVRTRKVRLNQRRKNHKGFVVHTLRGIVSKLLVKTGLSPYRENTFSVTTR